MFETYVVDKATVTAAAQAAYDAMMIAEGNDIQPLAGSVDLQPHEVTELVALGVEFDCLACDGWGELPTGHKCYACNETGVIQNAQAEL